MAKGGEIKPRAFAARMRQFAASIPGQSNRIKMMVFYEIGYRIVLNTPIDTGKARGNWYPSLGAPDMSVSESARGSGVSIGRIQSFVKSSTNPGTVYLTNSLPYIDLLDGGWSGQAPQGFTNKSIRQGLARAKKTQLISYPKDRKG